MYTTSAAQSMSVANTTNSLKNQPAFKYCNKNFSICNQSNILQQKSVTLQNENEQTSPIKIAISVKKHDQGCNDEGRIISYDDFGVHTDIHLIDEEEEFVPDLNDAASSALKPLQNECTNTAPPMEASSKKSSILKKKDEVNTNEVKSSRPVSRNKENGASAAEDAHVHFVEPVVEVKLKKTIGKSSYRSSLMKGLMKPSSQISPENSYDEKSEKNADDSRIEHKRSSSISHSPKYKGTNTKEKPKQYNLRKKKM